MLYYILIENAVRNMIIDVVIEFRFCISGRDSDFGHLWQYINFILSLY